MAKTKNELLCMTYSQIKDYCDSLNVNRPKNASKTTMIQLILTSNPPAIASIPANENDTNQKTNFTSTQAINVQQTANDVSMFQNSPQILHKLHQNGQIATSANLLSTASLSQPIATLSNNAQLASYNQMMMNTMMTMNTSNNAQLNTMHMFGMMPQTMQQQQQQLHTTANHTANNFREHQNINKNNQKQKPKTNDVTENTENKEADDAVDADTDREVCYFFNHRGCDRKCKFMHKRYVDVLREYHSVYYKSKDVNVKNIGIYLKNSLDGFAKIEDKENPGYIKYGTYARTFCEVVSNYILKEKSLDLTLYKKIQQLSHRPSFPHKEMNFIRLSTNKIIHGVNYNENARGRFIPQKDQHKMLLNIYIITRWINKEISRTY